MSPDDPPEDDESSVISKMLKAGEEERRHADFGSKRLSELQAGAAMRRRSSIESRISDVVELVARGQSARNAFKIVGKRHCVSESAVRSDYYKYRSKPLD